MNTRTTLIRTTIAIALSGALFTSAHATDTSPGVDARAPLAATLLQTVRVSANAAKPFDPPVWSVADGEPLRVTLMPTVRVTARADSLAVTTLPTVTVVAQAQPAADVMEPRLLTSAANPQSSHRPLGKDDDDGFRYGPKPLALPR